MTTYPDPFTEKSSFITDISPGIQFNHHYFASQQTWSIDTALQIGEVLKLVFEKCGEDTTREIVRAAGLSNYVSYRG